MNEFNSIVSALSSQVSLPHSFRGAELYGAVSESGELADCTVYDLSNETGCGHVAVYNVFTGIELYYNDMHLSYCNQEQGAARDVIEINHCAVGRYECSFGENGCCYMSPGDLSIGSALRKKSHSCFPLSHYHGITVLIDLPALLPEVRQLMELLSIDLERIHRYICTENRCCIMRASPSAEHIFSELYSVREQRKPAYMKLKVLELLLFLSDLDASEDVVQAEYLNPSQVKCAKEIAALITSDLTKHITINDLSRRFGLSPTALKRCFHGVYGTPIYSYMRSYRLQAAQKLLTETKVTIAEIAHSVGYENPNKFATAFKSVYGVTPTEFRTGVRLDR